MAPELGRASRTWSSAEKDLSRQRAYLAAQAAADCRGQHIVILDMRQVSDLFDYFVIVSGTSRRQLRAMADEIDRVLTQETGAIRLGIEGEADSRWILLDYGDVIIHLFEPETRAYYALEDLWSDATPVPFEAGQPDAPPPQPGEEAL
ncbi:MAG: ribosome silencing factor [Thermoguttaceae bacterium]|nr:ribosome silencing factor [Thermoguttaceae bacterium]